MAPGHFFAIFNDEKKLASVESLARVCSVNQQIGKDKKNRKEFKKRYKHDRGLTGGYSPTTITRPAQPSLDLARPDLT